MPNPNASQVLELARAETGDAILAMHRFSSPDYAHAWEDPGIHEHFARLFISKGLLARAANVAATATERFPESTQLWYLLALACARMRDVERADAIASRLVPIAPVSVQAEFLALQGRLKKDLYECATEEIRGLRLAEQSAGFYASALRLNPQSSFPCINAACMSLLAGHDTKARELAADAEALALAESPSFWRSATLAESSLIRGRDDDASKLYDAAVHQASRRLADIASMRRQVLLLNRRLGFSRDVMDTLGIGPIVIFRATPQPPPWKDGTVDRLDEQSDKRIRDVLRERIRQLRPAAAVCCPRAGAELLFAEAAIECGVPVSLCLPFKMDDFLARCVDFGLAGFAPLRQRFERLLRLAREPEDLVSIRHATTERYLGDDVLFEFGQDFALGWALMQADDLGSGTVLLEGREHPPEHAASTESVPRSVAGSGIRCETVVIPSRGEVSAGPTSLGNYQPPSRPWPTGVKGRAIKAMLFADVRGFSSMLEEHSPLFMRQFGEAVRRVLDAGDTPCEFANSWGDGLFFVFKKASDAAELAVRLLDHRGDWNGAHLGLPDGAALRIGLHVGPVYQDLDPVLDRDGFFGSHVTRAARIEPVAPAGTALASEQFSAMLRQEGSGRFQIASVGEEQLAKGFGRCRLFRVGRPPRV